MQIDNQNANLHKIERRLVWFLLKNGFFFCVHLGLQYLCDINATDAFFYTPTRN